MNAKWRKVNLYDENNKPKISRIIEIEWELTNAIRNDHKSFMGDEFREKRVELLQLRKELLNGNN
jgi:hypothetical protein